MVLFDVFLVSVKSRNHLPLYLKVSKHNEAQQSMDRGHDCCFELYEFCETHSFYYYYSFQWHHNEPSGVSNHRGP